MLFHGYNPYGPHKPAATPAPDVSLAVFRAAQRAGAHCLSADGKVIFTSRYGEILMAKWQDWPGEFGAWELTTFDDFPAGAVRL